MPRWVRVPLHRRCHLTRSSHFDYNESPRTLDYRSPKGGVLLFILARIPLGLRPLPNQRGLCGSEVVEG
jgi:hypothetical protein